MFLILYTIYFRRCGFKFHHIVSSVYLNGRGLKYSEILGKLNKFKKGEIVEHRRDSLLKLLREQIWLYFAKLCFDSG